MISVEYFLERALHVSSLKSTSYGVMAAMIVTAAEKKKTIMKAHRASLIKKWKDRIISIIVYHIKNKSMDGCLYIFNSTHCYIIILARKEKLEYKLC